MKKKTGYSFKNTIEAMIDKFYSICLCLNKYDIKITCGSYSVDNVKKETKEKIKKMLQDEYYKNLNDTVFLLQETQKNEDKN